MSTFDFTVDAGSAKRLQTAGKYCDRDIVVTATGSNAPELPKLNNPASEEEIFLGKEAINQDGGIQIGRFTISDELSQQDALISQIKAALQGKAAGGGGGESIDGIPAGYVRADYVKFNDAQIVDTGIIGNQDSRIQVCFTRENSSQRYLYGCASSNNTASVTAYMGGSWRFGNKYATKALGIIDEKISYAAIVDKTQITATNSVSSISGVNDFETIGTIIIGGCRNSDGSLSNGQFIGKLFYFVMWQGDEQVLKLIPVVSADGVYRLWDMVSKKFHDSITETPLEGGSL